MSDDIRQDIAEFARKLGEKNGRGYVAGGDARVFERIVYAEDGAPVGHVYAFVALADGENRTLGAWKRGDVFRPASWKAPAKHARGNIYALDGGLGCCGPYGVEYMAGSWAAS